MVTKVKVSYRDANNISQTAVLEGCRWTEIRGQRVLRGQQRINGRLVNRSLADWEVQKVEAQ
jgi:hypothetical protein